MGYGSNAGWGTNLWDNPWLTAIQGSDSLGFMDISMGFFTYLHVCHQGGLVEDIPSGSIRYIIKHGNGGCTIYWLIFPLKPQFRVDFQVPRLIRGGYTIPPGWWFGTFLFLPLFFHTHTHIYR